MKKLQLIIAFFFSVVAFSQNVLLTEVKTTHENRDKFLYSLQKDITVENQYLGKIEVIGYTVQDQMIFSQIYEKAKSIGANTYSIQFSENLEGTKGFDLSHYYVQLYYTESNKIPKEENTLYIINPSKEVKLRVNSNKQILNSRSYIKIVPSNTQEIDISVGSIFGSRIKFENKEGQPAQYFQISGNQIRSNSEENPGIHFKTGDIIKVEKSYAQFLVNIYQSMKSSK